MSYINIFDSSKTRHPDQTQKSHFKQVENSAGGYSFQATLSQRVMRFLVIGSANGSFYASPAKLTQASVVDIKACGE